jgi:fatty acid desaturase
MYAINLNTVVQFYKEKNFNYVLKMTAGTTLYCLFGWVACLVGGSGFALACVLYPLLENILLLSVVNWTWHCFLDSNNPENDYVLSWTALDGPINVLNEDYHVVHHQYPTAHWSKHPELYEKHLEDYKKNQASIFRNTHVFELFFLVILNNYDELARKFVDLSGKLTFEEKVELMKARLRYCSFGPKSKKVQ